MQNKFARVLAVMGLFLSLPFTGTGTAAAVSADDCRHYSLPGPRQSGQVAVLCMRIGPYRDTAKYAAHWTVTGAKANTKVLGYFDDKLINLSTSYSWWTFDKVVTVGACVNNECGTWVDIWRNGH